MIKKFYLKLLMSLLLVALAVPQVQAETLTIGESASSTNQYYPVYNSYWSTTGASTQMIFPLSEISSLPNGAKITKITFYATSSISSNVGKSTVVVRLGNTSISNFTSTGQTLNSEMATNRAAMTSVFTGNLPTGNTTMEIDCSSNDFYYESGKNLMVDFYVSLGESGTFSTKWVHASASSKYCASSTGNSAYSDSYLPKMTITYETSGGSVAVNPTSLNFNESNTYVGGSYQKNFTVANTTEEAVNITMTGDNVFTFNPSTVAAGATETITVTYAPTEVGTNNATLTVGGKTVTLAGTAVAAPTPTITVNPTTLSINATVGETKTATFTVTGTDLTGDISVAASEGFTVSPATIAAADAANGVTVTVSFTPTVAGTKTGTITITSAGAESKTVNVNATATGAGNEIFTVDKESLDFGTVTLGQSKTLSVKITNNTDENINPVFTFNNNVFSVEDDSYPVSVSGGLSQTYNIVYTPQAAGADFGTVTISVGSNSVTVNLTGNCVEQAAYDIASSAASGVHNFGDVFKDGIATWNVTLTNNGANAVTPVIEGLAAPFTAENVPATLAAGESATITFKFAPTAIQAYGPTSIVVKFAETTAFQFDYTFRGNGIENTGTLPPSTFDNETYTWTDDNGDEHTSPYSEIATDPNQMIALMKAVYTNKNIPGNYYRGYTTDKVGQDEVAYPAIGAIERNYTSGVGYTHDFYDAYGWGIDHDETNYPMSVTEVPGSTYNKTYYVMNPNEYKPNQEGVTLLLVEMKDGAGASTITTKPTSYASLKNVFSKMFKSVRVVPNSKKVSKTVDIEGTATNVPGTLFKIDCDKMNRFFFLAKGRLRFYPDENSNSSAYFLDNVKTSGSGGSSYKWNDKENDKENETETVNPFNMMYEQFSPVTLTGTSVNATDIYQSLINMDSYVVEHDCESVPWASSGSVSGHEFNMYGKSSISDDCQDVRDLMFFVPDYRMMYWSGRDKGTNSDEYTNYYKQFAPTMGMYVIHQNEITGERNGTANEYTLHLSWESNLTDFVPGENGEYTIYLVNADGTYTPVATGIPSSQTTYDLTVNMGQHGQQVTYVIQGQDNTGFLSLQMSNEESFIIPGTDASEIFQLVPNVANYSRFDPQTVQNFYANGLQIKAYPGANASDYAGKTFNFYRKAATETGWTLIGTAEVNNEGTSATVSMVETTQRQQSEYKFGYKANPATIAMSADAHSYKVFDLIYDNFKADVSANEHPSSYSYKMETADGAFHSNEMSVKVYKTQMRNLTGTFNEEYVENDKVRQDVDNSRQFDIDVEHSSKTEILRYGAYRWDSSYGDAQKPYAILDLNSSADEEEDVSPAGQASNQGEYYSVYMNGDSYIGNDVYVAQGQTGQATFVDDVPATTNAAEEYTYVPVIETFTGRADYNTYGAPMQTTATGKIVVSVENAGMSKYTWEAGGNTYRYYNVFVNVNTLDLPEGYEVAKIRAWRKIDASYLNEKLEAYAYRANLDANGEFMFDDPTAVPANDKLGSEPLQGSSSENEMYKGTFGALDVANGATIPMKFFVRVYFTKDGDDTPAVTYDPIYVIGDNGNGWSNTTSIGQLTSTDGSNYNGSITTGDNVAYIAFTTTLEDANTNWFGAVNDNYSAPFNEYVAYYWGSSVKAFVLSPNKTYNITVSDFHKKSDNYNNYTAGTVAITEASAKAPMLRDTNDGKYYITEVEVDGVLDDQIPTSIFGVVTVKEVAGVKYYNMAGIESDVPFQGVNIEVTTYTDGSRTTRKIMK